MNFFCGASGLVGSAIEQVCSPKYDIVRAGRKREVEVDDTGIKSVIAMFEQVGKFDALVVVVGNDSHVQAL